MIEDLRDRVAVITGGASGIGRGMARAVARAGGHVVIADVEIGRAESVADELRALGAEALAVATDVTDRASIERLADQAWERFGHVDLVANNAGVFSPMASLLKTDEANARWVLEVNLMGVFSGCQVFGRRLVEQGTPAHIINTGSENSLGVPHTHAAMYTASKHAVLGLSDVLRRELPAFIGVSVLCPGMVRTDIGRSTRNRHDRFGGALDRPVVVDESPRVTSGDVLDADEIGERAIAGVLRGDFYIVTHPPVRELVAERAAEALGAFDAQAPRFDGDERLDTRVVMARRT